jgi:N-methylhydantoinase B/oxoprolinase/acetone carboxylase alpha subunit
MRASLNVKEVMQNTEKFLKEQAELILKAKQIGVHQESISKMVAWFAVSKAHYDVFKARYEENGK